ncbi:putative holin-like toxin [Lentibacillus sp. JNUCC-1]
MLMISFGMLIVLLMSEINKK